MTIPDGDGDELPIRRRALAKFVRSPAGDGAIPTQPAGVEHPDCYGGEFARRGRSLAAAIGYPDLVSVANTMTQIAPAISLFMIVMVSYLSMSLLYSLIGNLYNRMIRFKAA